MSLLKISLVMILCCLASTRLMAQDTSGVSFTAIQPVKKTISTAVIAAPIKSSPAMSLAATFFAGLLGGFAALLMPCIFPMLPLTVGFFTKRKGGFWDAALYGFSIIIIYVALGMLITILFGPSALNKLATNGAFNFLFFILLLLFAASFLGGFELTLPNRWINKAEENTERKGFAGIFLMAAVLALVSFSCTGPIIGTLLVQTAASGARLAPAIGMFGFALALAMPFVLFALFPSWLQALPKSGGWMNTVKISLGFLELALSLKFLANVDPAYHCQWLNRDVFLVLWIMICGCFSLYLLVKLHLTNDGADKTIGVPRLFVGILTGAFCLFMIPGLWGAPLKSIAPFLPPQDTQDFDLYTPKSEKTVDVKYGNLFHAPLGLTAFFDFGEGMAYAKKVHKPVLIDFTGHACVNCCKMEATVWPDKNVLPLLQNNYVLIQFYVDDKTPEAGSTIGDINSNLQAAKFNSNSQPDYVLLDDNGNLLIKPQGADYDPAAYAVYLQNGINTFQKKIKK